MFHFPFASKFPIQGNIFLNRLRDKSIKLLPNESNEINLHSTSFELFCLLFIRTRVDLIVVWGSKTIYVSSSRIDWFRHEAIFQCFECLFLISVWRTCQLSHKAISMPRGLQGICKQTHPKLINYHESWTFRISINEKFPVGIFHFRSGLRIFSEILIKLKILSERSIGKHSNLQISKTSALTDYEFAKSN